MNELKAGVEGWLTWELITADGEVIESGHQHNLITNTGLDSIAGGFFAMQQFGHLGTGNTPPAFTDVALSNQVARSQNTAPGSDAFISVSQGHYRRTRIIEFQESEGNGNLTEWGFSTGGDICVRELFRDGAGNPVVVTKTNGVKLRLSYALDVIFPDRSAPVPTSLAVAGLGNLAGHSQVLNYREFQLYDQLVRAFRYSGGQAENALVAATDAQIRSITYGTYISASVNIADCGMADGNPAPAYVPGSYSRPPAVYTFDTGKGNGTYTGFMLLTFGNNGYTWVGFVQTFDPGQELVKDSAHRLTVQGPSVSWGRA